ncbi:hypothetical protein CWI37_0251p0010 [Hamiltosporidium tvaerminnensis]|uniref:Uncharacterized protein n=1 Tax=Hamiltosporidium tvaerminnensis TaxID=1176355 RepID=A0A4Q9L8X7_9MICR|nr:hypothetical protein LUQ84_003364 [Hamiltosporidium tvaerminnensis]TBU03685.1 hypothetical protein CWI37_0251p0010 [Hamiltosporidium tvaerminnensis]
MINLIDIIFISMVLCSDESQNLFFDPKENLLESDNTFPGIFLSIQNLCSKVIEKKEKKYDILLKKGFLVFLSNINVFIEKQSEFQFIFDSHYKSDSCFLLLAQIDDIPAKKDLSEFFIKNSYDCNYKIFNRQRKKNGKMKKFEVIEYEEIKKNSCYLFKFKLPMSAENLFTFIKKVQGNSNFFKKEKENYLCVMFKDFLSGVERSIIEISLKNLKTRKLDKNTVIYISINKQDFVSKDIYPVFNRKHREMQKIYGYFFSLAMISSVERENLKNIPTSALIMFKKINLVKEYHKKYYKAVLSFYKYPDFTLEDFNCKKLVYSVIKRIIFGFCIEINIEYKPMFLSIISKKKYRKIINLKLIWDDFEENFIELTLSFDSNDTMNKFVYRRSCYADTHEKKEYQSLEEIRSVFDAFLEEI